MVEPFSAEILTDLPQSAVHAIYCARYYHFMWITCKSQQRNLLLSNFEGIAAVQVRSSFFWIMAQMHWVGRVQLIGNFRHLQTGVSRFLETSGTNHPVTLRQMPEERKHQRVFYLWWMWTEIPQKRSNHLHMQHKLTGFL